MWKSMPNVFGQDDAFGEGNKGISAASQLRIKFCAQDDHAETSKVVRKRTQMNQKGLVALGRSCGSKHLNGSKSC
jgi:hypothetical protein